MKTVSEEEPRPSLKEDEILLRITTQILHPNKFIRDSVATPKTVGFDPAGEIVEIGAKWAGKYSVGDKCTLLSDYGNRENGEFSGTALSTYLILPPQVMESERLLTYRGDGYYKAALSRSYSRAIRACRSLYRTDSSKHIHYLGIKEGGRMAILGGGTPEGLAVIDYALSGEFRPRQLVVTDCVKERLNRARSLFSSRAEARGITLIFINPKEIKDLGETMKKLTENEGFNDMLVMLYESELFDTAEGLLAFNGCLNFTAEPEEENLSVGINYYDVHFSEKHIVGSGSGKTEDIREALELMEHGMISPEVLVTHVGGNDAVSDNTLNESSIIYTGISMPLIALDALETRAGDSLLYTELARMVRENNGLWNLEAENFLLANGTEIQ